LEATAVSDPRVDPPPSSSSSSSSSSPPLPPVSASAATPGAAGESRAVKVTFFEDRAQVVRVGSVAVTAGASWVALAGLSPVVDDGSLEVRAPAGIKVLGARIRRRVVHEAAAGREALAALEAELSAAEDAVVAAERALARAQRQGESARQLLGEWATALAQVPPFLADPVRLGEWRRAWDAADAAAATAHAGLHAAHATLVAAEESAERAALRLGEGLRLTPRRETVAEVQLEAGAAGSVELELRYRLPCALWRPEHVARLDGGELELTTMATVWQRTGERWNDVEVVFSTARPGRIASPPLISDDVLHKRRKTDEEKKRIVVEARDQTVAVAGLDRGARAVDEMPGVDDGGEPLSFGASQRVSMVSDGRPLRVELTRRRLPAKVELVAWPERALAAHLRATATLTGGGPILAGPVRLARGAGYVGRSKLGFVAPGEPFELGFGADDGVRVRRTIEEKRETVPVIGTQRVSRVVRLFLSNLSGHPRVVEVTERVPVSEIDDVSIAVEPDQAWRTADPDGLCRRSVSLAAGATETVALAYEIKAAAKVALPF
jgi:uncharacterized protein (TIGR02231 family)